MKSQLAAGQLSSNGGREEGGTRWKPRKTRKGRTYELLVTASSMDGFGLKVGDLLERMILFRKGTRGEPWEGEVNTRGDQGARKEYLYWIIEQYMKVCSRSCKDCVT